MTGLNILRGAVSIVPATILLTVSFFVLVVVRKVEGEALKVFGYVIAVFLWISAAFILAGGLYLGISGQRFFPHSMHDVMGERGIHEMMKGQSDCFMSDKIMKGKPDQSSMGHMMNR